MTQEKANEASVDGADGGAATAVAPVKKPQPPKHKLKKLPPFKVLLHNDDVNTLDHVVKSIRRLTTLDPQQAVLRTIEAHETGVALLLTTHKERAELYCEQFASLSITVTTEPAGT